MEKQQISCPQCGTLIDVSQALAHQLEEEIGKRHKEEYDLKYNELDKKTIALQAEAKRLQTEKASLKEQVDSEVGEKLRVEKQKIRDEESRRISSEKQEEMRALQEELTKRTEDSKDLNKTRIELERLKREKESIEDTVRAEAEQRLSKELSNAKTKWIREHDQQSENRVLEKQHIIDQLQSQINEMKRKAEQGSMQIQGEVQELAIEEWLMDNFPFDNISEVKKGVRGGDCLQTVNTRERQNCGTIYYESKRTKDFQPSWIEKFKADMRSKGATLGVIVTEAMPKDMERLGLVEGVWICTFDEFKSLCYVLRDSLIRISNALVTQENRGDKMAMMYSYLTSEEFRMQVEAAAEGIVQMKSDIDSERRAMERIWKQREKQVEKTLLNITYIYGTLKGIAGNSIQSVQILELPEAS